MGQFTVEQIQLQLEVNGRLAGKTLRDINKEYRSLNAQVKNLVPGTDKFIRKTRELQLVKKRMQQVRAEINGTNSALSRSGGFMASLKGSLAGFASVSAGVALGIGLLVKGLRSAFNTVKEFEQAQAKLNAVLGDKASAENLRDLGQAAKDLGGITKFTAGEVSQLQIELAKLGFDPREIQDASKAILDFAVAADTDLANAAAVAGITIRQFGLDASETTRVVDVASKAFSSSALDIDKFKESMKFVAPVAKVVGLSVEETTALLGTLADSGISGSQAGTALRKTFIELAKTGQTLEQAINQVNASEDKLSAASDLVGKRAATAFLVLADGTEKTKELNKALQDVAGTAEEMADKQLATLEGSFTRLNSTWDKAVLSFEDGSGLIAQATKLVTENVSDGIDKFTKGLNTAQVIIVGVIKAFDNLIFKSIGVKNTLIEFAKTLGTTDAAQDVFAKRSEDAADKVEALRKRFKQFSVDIIRDQSRGLIIESFKALGLSASDAQKEYENLTETGRKFIDGIDDQGEGVEQFGDTLASLRKELSEWKKDREDLLTTDVKTRNSINEEIKLIEAKIKVIEDDGKASKKAAAAKKKAAAAAKKAAEEAAQKEFDDLVKRNEKEGTAEAKQETKLRQEKNKLIQKFNDQRIDEIIQGDEFLLDEKIKIFQAQRDVELRNAELSIADDELLFLRKLEIEKEFIARSKEAKDLAAKEDQEREDGKLEDLLKLLQVGQNFFNQFMGLRKQIRQKDLDEELNNIEGKHEKELELLQGQLDSESISKQQFDAKKKALDKKTESQTRALQQAAFNREQGAAIATAIFNGGVAVTKTIAQLGGVAAITPIGLALIAGVVAGTTLQVATIANQSPPFAAGGFTGAGFGSPDSSGHKPAGVVHANEWVAPAWMTRSPRHAATIRSLEAARSSNGRGYAHGGSVEPVGQQAQDQAEQPTADGAQGDRLTDTLDRLNATLDRGIPGIFDFQNFEDGVNQINELREESSLRKAS